jgi:hypothetical protein
VRRAGSTSQIQVTVISNFDDIAVRPISVELRYSLHLSTVLLVRIRFVRMS